MGRKNNKQILVEYAGNKYYAVKWDGTTSSLSAIRILFKNTQCNIHCSVSRYLQIDRDDSHECSGILDRGVWIVNMPGCIHYTEAEFKDKFRIVDVAD